MRRITPLITAPTMSTQKEESAAVLRHRLDIINEHMKDAAKLMEDGCEIDVPDIINECIELSKREATP